MARQQANVMSDVEQKKLSDERVVHIKRSLIDVDLDVDEVADILDLDKSTVQRYLRARTIVGYQVGRTWKVPLEELQAYKQRMLDRHREEARRAALEAEAERKFLMWRRTQPERDNRLEPCRNCEAQMVTWQHTYFDDTELVRHFGRTGKCEACGEQLWREIVDPLAEVDWTPPEIIALEAADQRRIERLKEEKANDRTPQ